MSKSIQLKKLKRAMYICLRWRLQLPNYVPHNPVPNFVNNPTLKEFSKGVICAYADLMKILDEIERADNQRKIYPKRKDQFFPVFGNKNDEEESYVDEMRWGKGQGNSG